jgi:ADP-ribosyltransferase exoenzyme
MGDAKAALAAEAKIAAKYSSKPKPPPKPKPPKPDTFPGMGEDLKVIRTLGGSTGAKLVEDKNGKQYVLKTGGNHGHLREEVAADELYRAMGLDVPRSKLYERPGGPVKLSEFHAGKTLGELERTDPAGYQAAVWQLRKGFVADALMGNWDVIGASADNILVTPAGKVLRIDNGGLLRYRAQGALKSSSQWGNTVSELSSLRNSGINPAAAKIFGSITDAEIKQQAKDLLRSRAKNLKAAPKELRETLAQRLDNLKEFGKPQKAEKPIQVGDWKSTPAHIFQTFETTSQADAWAKRHYEAWAQSLSPAERDAIGEYKGSSYDKLNRYLRNPDQHTLTPQIKKWTEEIDKALAKNLLPEPVTAVRYFPLASVGLSREDLKVGRDITDKGYASTSVNPHHQWGGQRFEVRIPAGTPAGYVQLATGSMQSEYELLLGRGADTFRVVELKDDSHKTVVVELVQPTVHADKKPKARK